MTHHIRLAYEDASRGPARHRKAARGAGVDKPRALNVALSLAVLLGGTAPAIAAIANEAGGAQQATRAAASETAQDVRATNASSPNDGLVSGQMGSSAAKDTAAGSGGTSATNTPSTGTSATGTSPATSSSGSTTSASAPATNTNAPTTVVSFGPGGASTSTTAALPSVDLEALTQAALAQFPVGSGVSGAPTGLSMVEDGSFTITAAEVSSIEDAKPSYINGSYSASALGMSGTLSVSVSISDGAISSVYVSNPEVESEIGQQAIETLPTLIMQAGSTSGIDTVTGATVTSNAIIQAVNSCLAQATGRPTGTSAASSTTATASLGVADSAASSQAPAVTKIVNLDVTVESPFVRAVYHFADTYSIGSDGSITKVASKNNGYAVEPLVGINSDLVLQRAPSLLEWIDKNHPHENSNGREVLLSDLFTQNVSFELVGNTTSGAADSAEAKNAAVNLSGGIESGSQDAAGALEGAASSALGGDVQIRVTSDRGLSKYSGIMTVSYTWDENGWLMADCTIEGGAYKVDFSNMLGKRIGVWQGVDGDCYGGRANPMSINVKNYDPQGDTITADITLLFHNHLSHSSGSVENDPGDTVYTATDILIPIATEMNKEEVFYQKGMFGGPEQFEIRFTTNSSSPMLKIEVETTGFNDSGMYSVDTTDTYTIDFSQPPIDTGLQVDSAPLDVTAPADGAAPTGDQAALDVSTPTDSSIAPAADGTAPESEAAPVDGTVAPEENGTSAEPVA